MPKSKFEEIRDDIEQKIIAGSYSGGMLPTEVQLCDHYGCSRNTVRRAIEQLSQDGYVQSIRGRGVVILDRLESEKEVDLDLSDFFGARSISRSKRHDTKTHVLTFKKISVDQELALKTSLPVDSPVYYLERLRILDGHPWVLDINYFLCDVVKNLTLEIAEDSIYRYMDESLGYRVIGSRRSLRIERATQQDKKLLELDGCNCVGILSSNAFIDSGRMFEFTESRYSPEHFSFSLFVSN